METGAVRPYATIAHDPPARRDDVAGSQTVTDLPTEKTVRAAQATSGSNPSDTQDRPQDRPAVRTGFERDAASGTIVYRWVEQATDTVIVEIPRAEKIRSRVAYADPAAPGDAASRHVDRSV